MTLNSLEEILTFPFRDKEWQNKLLIGSLVVLANFVVPILPLFLVYGYGVRIARRVINGDGELYLPEWDDWGGLFVDGARIVGVSFVSALPLIIIAFAGQGLLMAGSIVPALVAETAGGEAALVLAMVSTLLGVGGGFAVFGATMVLSLAMGILLPVITGHVIATGEFAAAFRVREWWPIFRANVGGYLLVLILVFGIGLALGMVLQILYLTVCLCCLVPILMGPCTTYTTLVSFTLYARAYRMGAHNLAAQAE
jgi:hypothetical protein